MKRNLFAIFLAVMLVAALVIVASPNSKAADADVITAVADTEYNITDNSKVFDLNGQKNVTVNIASGVTLSVIDSANMELDGATAGELTKTGDGKIASVTLYGNYRYLAVETDGKYAFHPFNMAITRRGVNTKQKTISLEAQFVANNVVRDMITDFGIKNITKNTCHSAKPNFDFEKEYADGDGVSNNTKNGAKAYYDLVGSLEQDALKEERIFCAYIKINGIDEPIFGNQRVDVTPEKVLTNINGNFNNFTHKQKTLMSEMVKGTDYLETLCGSFATFTGKLPIDSSFSLVEGGTQHYEFEGIEASKNYYIQFTLSAPTTAGYVGVAHWGNEQNYFYDTVSDYGAENYYHTFSGVVNGEGRVYGEPAKYFEGNNHNGLTGVNFAESGMTITSVRTDDRIYTFINGKRIATYVIEDEIAAMDTIPVLYFYDASGTYYDGEISNISIVCGAEAAVAKVAELNTGSAFNYVATPNWHQSKLDATFNDDGGFSYAYDSSNTTTARRFFNGVNDRVFLADDYYYQYEISGDMAFENVSDSYGLFFNWINTKTLSSTIDYKHEVNFCMNLNGGPLGRLTFDKGKGVSGDGATNWVSNTTVYGGQNNLSGNAAWQEAIKGGLIVRIERTVVNNTTDSYVITVTAKSNPALIVKSTPIEVSNADFGGYNWILFGTQSVKCTVSNVQFGKIVKEDPDAGKFPVDESFALTEGGRQHYEFSGITASKYYYIQMQLSAPTTAGYVGIAHWGDENNYFYDTVSYDATENYRHEFAGIVNGAGKVNTELAKFFEGDSKKGLTGANFGTDGMTITSVRTGDRIYTFINGVRIATYLIESELAAMDMVPALYFYDRNGNYYNGEISDITIVAGETDAIAKVAELNTGNAFNYVNTPNWDSSKGHMDATFSGDSFTYKFDANASSGDRRYSTGVNDRVFLGGTYYYQYEISGDFNAIMTNGCYGLFYNWVNTGTPYDANSIFYRHEANFCLKMNGDKLQRMTFDKGNGASGDGSSNWASNTTAYGGRNDLESDTAWQAAFKGGLIVRIERAVINGNTDTFVITVTSKSNPEMVLTSTAIQNTYDTFGSYNWILFGTQSVDCTISNVEFGRE